MDINPFIPQIISPRTAQGRFSPTLFSCWPGHLMWAHHSYRSQVTGEIHYLSVCQEDWFWLVVCLESFVFLKRITYYGVQHPRTHLGGFCLLLCFSATTSSKIFCQWKQETKWKITECHLKSAHKRHVCLFNYNSKVLRATLKSRMGIRIELKKKFIQKHSHPSPLHLTEEHKNNPRTPPLCSQDGTSSSLNLFEALKQTTQKEFHNTTGEKNAQVGFV